MAKTLRDIIVIDEDLCDGCGDCITACAEGALELVDGKARLKAEILCDGAGVCLGHCPTGALTVIKREADEYSEAAVEAELKKTAAPTLQTLPNSAGCPGMAARQWTQPVAAPRPTALSGGASQLTQWPVQLMLVSPQAPYFKNADLLITADCVPFAHPGYHDTFLKGRALAVGCPKLDDLQHYLDKLTQIFAANNLRSVEVLLMEVPCCNGLGQATQMARQQAGQSFPIKITTIGIRGDILGTIDV
ncbi:MAG: 4Fe-4S binding protein [candidate division Zixibacteria bacterium]|nr:4Fe-4S binding protein [candidate division Zixibacteria bacterium]